MFKFRKPKKDIRFLDPESLKNSSGFRSKSENILRVSNAQERNLNVNFVTEQLQELDDSWVKVEQAYEKSSSFLKLINDEVKKPYRVKNNFEINDVETLPLFDVEENFVTLKIGVFSDSRIYSALIQSLLEPYSISIGHFNHPKTFVKERFNDFDEISVWIIFLSDEDESDFLDQFLSRYDSKPTLFLFPKMNKENCQSRINDFVLEHGLVEKERIN